MALFENPDLSQPISTKIFAMKLNSDHIAAFNQESLDNHSRDLDFLAQRLSWTEQDISQFIENLARLQIAIPSWALGSGGTRFGRFPIGGQPRNLEEKIADVGLLHQLSQMAGRISLHIPWDIPDDTGHIQALAAENNLAFDAMNSNTFQDQPDQQLSYKYGSLAHTDPAVRRQAVDHNKQVIDYGKSLGSKSLTVWLADGSNHPGQSNLSRALARTADALAEIYDHMPRDWSLFIEYKPFEPYFYSTVIPDWGTSYLLASDTGDRAYTLVDLGHHLPNTNIEQVVATLISRGKLGGFHFNDSKYADDDITVGSIKPYQLFLIFMEIIQGTATGSHNPEISYMIDASHNLKDPLLDLLESLEAIGLAYIKASLIDFDALALAQNKNDISQCSAILHDAFHTDVRPILREYRIRQGGAIDPIEFYRQQQVREKLITERGQNTMASGL